MCYKCPTCKVELKFKDTLFGYLCTTFYCENGHALELDYAEYYDGEEETNNFTVVEANSDYADYRV